jgi:hypothetical protein
MSDIKVNVPVGMNPDDFLKMFEKWKVSRETAGVKAKARSKAVSELTKKYDAEFKGLLKKYSV